VRRTLDRAGVGPDPDAAGDGAVSTRPYPLDLTINAPSRIFVRGRGLDAELGGSLRLSGTTGDVIPIGRFDLLRGRLDVLGQRFALTEGYAQLQGDFTPYLRLVARTEARSGTDVSIIVEGPADDPQVSFESSPELPQDEVLAQLLFGRDLSSISPLQAVQLASAVATLSGRGGGGALEGFREGLDLDDFDVTTDEDGNAAVRAGKYISENIYTDITIGSDGTSEINLNLDVTDDVTARGSFGSEGESSLGIFYERDY
jgi:translocation and assembly module TamB